MALTSRFALIEALASGRPEDLLGMAESSWLDFKSSPYQLDVDKNRFELCKDVAAFANAQGGLLVLGIGAEKKSHQALEVASTCQPFPQNKANVDRYIDTLNEYLRPRVTISHSWYADLGRSSPEGTVGYLVIEVDPVPEPDRYVIVRRTLNDKEKFAEGLAIPIRHSDRTIYLPSEDAYRLINEGLRGRDAPRGAPGPAGGKLHEAAAEDLQTLERLQDWGDVPVLFWQSVPPSSAGILPAFYSDSGVHGALKKQDVLRPSGFNFRDNYGRLQIHEGAMFLGRGRCALLIRPDGLMTAGAVATPDMLCWAMEQRNQPQRINAHVLSELTLEYFRLADTLVVPQVPGTWRHRIATRRFQGEQPRTLGSGAQRLDTFLSPARPASADFWDQTWQAVGDPERDAFEALSRIYALFGLDATANPDVLDDRVATQRFYGD
ncbi:ATP-binding protein [Streptosporangium sp. NPDC006013]|uniref:AlbA family DNA-binding domain-containing protein n=1 Tax=Streptosporangium sp. NPDC006013 TaxID=3155596 RepID=UPI0033A1F514